jgi:hypothetical protein
MSAFSEEGSDPALDGEILLILCVTLGNIAGKGAEIDDEKQYRIDDAGIPDKYPHTRKCKKGICDPVECNE